MYSHGSATPLPSTLTLHDALPIYQAHRDLVMQTEVTDLVLDVVRLEAQRQAEACAVDQRPHGPCRVGEAVSDGGDQIGRASCRERGETSVVAGRATNKGTEPQRARANTT